MIAALLAALLLGAPGPTRPAFPSRTVTDHAAVAVVPETAFPPAAVQEATGQEWEGHSEEEAEGHREEWGTDVMMHHIVDSRELELGPWKISLEPLRVPPVEFAGQVIDLSPTRHVVFLWIAALLTILTVWGAAWMSDRTDHGRKAPGGFLNLFESFYVYLRDEVALANIGHGGERFVPYVVTLFFFILYANLLGLVPQGSTPTSNIMVTAAMALLSLFLIELSGMQALGTKGWLRTIFYLPEGIPLWMKPVMIVIMTPVELIGKLAKPFALAVRLFANMTAGHFVILALLGLILTYGSFARVIGVATIGGSLALGLFVMFLEIFVALLQAYIFAALTAVFIGLIRHAH